MVTSALESNGADELSTIPCRIIGEESYSAGQDKRFLLTDVSSECPAPAVVQRTLEWGSGAEPVGELRSSN